MANLNLNRILPISISYAQPLGQVGNFGTLLILSADVRQISPSERLRQFNDADAVASVFGVTSSEAVAARAYFSQSPPPRACYIGRWCKMASDSILGNLLPTLASDPLWAQLKAITNASFSVQVDKTTYQVKPFTLASVTNLTTLKAAITAALAASTPAVPVTVYGDDAKGELNMRPTAANVSMSVLQPPQAGTDISSLIRLAASSPNVWLSYSAPAESLLEAVSACRAAAGDWYGIVFADNVTASDDDILAVSDLVESWKNTAPGIFFPRTGNANLLSATVTNDLSSRAKAKALRKTQVIYSSADPNLGARVAGYMFSVDFTSFDSVRSVGNKVLVGAIPDQIQQGQDATLESKRANYCATWGTSGAYAIYRSGIMGDGTWADEVHGLDWFQSAVQIAIMNVFVGARTKVPQTRAGQVRVNTAIEKVCAQGVRAGLFAPGVWNQPGFGALSEGDTLPNGFYVWAEPLDTQSPADRQARLLPPVHVATCGAGSAQGMLTSIVFQP